MSIDRKLSARTQRESRSSGPQPSMPQEATKFDDLRDHDYIGTDESCPVCGGRVLVDIAFEDRWWGLVTRQLVQSYDCQEVRCGHRFTPGQWSLCGGR